MLPTAIPSVQQFDGTFYMDIRPTPQDYEEIKFDFLTQRSDVALLSTTSETRRDSIRIVLEDGKLRAYVKIGDNIQVHFLTAKYILFSLIKITKLNSENK